VSVQSGLLQRAVARQVVAQVDRALARRSLREFTTWVYPQFRVARHHAYLFGLLDSWLAGEYGPKFLAVSMPPRHSKSMVCSQALPAWYLGRYPDRSVIHASYAASLSNEFSRLVRDLIRDDRYQQLFQTAVSDEKSAVTNWRTTRGGGLRSVGVGGGITGHGADLFIIDDIHKEGDQFSPAALAAAQAWYTTAARTRLMPGGRVLLVGTRWHTQDLVGFVEQMAAQGGDEWLFVRLPGLALEDDPLGRQPGEALWPEWFGEDDLARLRVLDPASFDSLYQQEPRSSSSVVFAPDDLRRGEQPEGAGAWCFDLAISSSELADFTAFARVVSQGDTLYFSHLTLARGSWPEIRDMILALMAAYPADEFVFPAHLLELMAVQELQHVSPGSLIISEKTPGDKVARAQAYAAMVQAGRVVFEESDTLAVWWGQHVTFGEGVAHDDAVDVGSLAAHHFFTQYFGFAMLDGVGEEDRWASLIASVPG